jgi:Domain of unknown function (DUF4375)
MTQSIAVETGFKTSIIDTEEKACEILEPIMDTAYKMYELNPRWGFGEFQMNLDVKVRNVVSIGKLNQQVCNGGFMQWRDNGYNENPEFLLQALRALGTSTAMEVLALVNDALDIDTDTSDEYGDEDEDKFDAVSEEFDALDEAFYKVNEKLLCELANHVLTDSVVGS